MNETTQGERLRTVREMLKLNRKDFSASLNISDRKLRSIEIGEQNPTGPDFEAIGKAYPWAIHFVTYDGPLELLQFDNSPDVRRLRAESAEYVAMEAKGKVLTPLEMADQNKAFAALLHTLADDLDKS